MKMTLVTLMGFSSGIPLLLIGSTLKVWLTEEGVDLALIGAFSLTGLPYTLKFLWAPLLDRYTLPFLGRRRGWLVISQLALITVLFCFSLINPKNNTFGLAGISLLLAFLSATQDILVDAYRREILKDEELGLGSSLAVNGYRVALLFSGAFALYLADHLPWAEVYRIMALGLCVGLVTVLLAPEPKVQIHRSLSIQASFIEPFKEFFMRPGAWTILAFIVLYKIGDSMASDMSNPFYLHLGFSKTEIGGVAKLFGFWATIAGGVIGGAMMLKIGINKALWIFGVLQAVSILSFSWLALIGHSVTGLAAAITAENLTSGMGTAAYAAFMASQTNRQFTATQYALLSSLMGIPRVIASAPTGWMAKELGWPLYFVVCGLIAIPGLLFLTKIAPWREQK